MHELFPQQLTTSQAKLLLTSITSCIYQWARSQPESPAVIWNDVTLSYAAFWRAIEASRRFFEKQNLPAGRTAMVLIHNLLDSWIIVMGLRAQGLDTISVQSFAQAQTLGLKDVACIVVAQAEPGTHRADHPAAGIKLISVPAAMFANIHSGDLLFDQQHARPLGGHILYTSGTTGTYKKVMMSGANEARRNEARARSWSFGRNTVHHGVDFPLWTGAGFKQPSAVWHAGGCVVLDQRPGKFNRFFRYPITNAALIPTMLKALLKEEAASDGSAKDFELAIGAGFLSIGLAKKTVLQLTKRLEIQYGATELGTYALHSRFSSVDDLHWLTPADGCKVQVVDNNGVECPIGQEGELCILTTDNDCKSYLDDEETSEKVFRDGFFYPGDMAVQRADGRIRILGRTVDVLNLHGNKVAVAPIEQMIQRHLDADDVCLFSGLNDQGNEELVIAIQSAQVLSGPTLAAVKREFASFERVRIVVMKEFPRDDSGMRKIRRSELRKFVFSESERHH